MTTLAQQRAAIAAGISSARAATGGDERRAIGKRIETERRGAEVVEDLNRLINPTRQRRTLRTVPPVGALPTTRGRGNYTPPPATGGGIASPLTERTRTEEGEVVPDRTYYTDPEVVTTSTDGMLSFVVKPIRTTRFTDANGALEVREYARPS